MIRSSRTNLSFNDAFSYLFFQSSRPERLNVLISLMDRVKHGDYWRLLGEVWCDCEFPRIALSTWICLFGAKFPKRELVMSTGERKGLRRLPDLIDVYRGFAGQRGKGLSWTTDREKAIWFAKRFPFLGRPKLIVGECRKADVLAYFDRREESEVVIDPKNVMKQKRIEL